MIEYTSTPTNFYEDYISHYGTKGMKWGIRRRYRMPSTSDAYKRVNAMSDDDYWKRVNAAKLVGKKGSSASKTAKAKAAKKEAAGKSAKEKKTAEKEKVSTQDIKASKPAYQVGNYINFLKQELQRDRSQLPKARSKAEELEMEKRKKEALKKRRSQ